MVHPRVLEVLDPWSMGLELVEQQHLVLVLVLVGQRLVLVLVLAGQMLVLVEVECLVLGLDLVGIRLAVQVGLLLVELVFLSPSGLCSLSNLFVAMLVVLVQLVPWLAAHTLMVGSSLSEGCCGWSQNSLS